MTDAAEENGLALYADAAARLLDLPIPVERRAAVIEHLRLAQRLAAVVREHPLSDGDEPAPVFRP